MWRGLDASDRWGEGGDGALAHMGSHMHTVLEQGSHSLPAVHTGQLYPLSQG